MASEYKPNLGVISITAATVTLNADGFAGRTIVLNRAAGVTVTLPASTGSGYTYEIVVGTTLTGNGIIQVANSTDVMAGTLDIATDIAGVTCPTTSTSDTITMNGTTTGGIIGSRVLLQDMRAGFWSVTGGLVSSGAEATPFSAAV
jgi:hypothetical protein